MIPEIILYGSIFIALSTTLGLTLYRVKVKKTQSQLPAPIALETIETLILALGDLDNITDIKYVHQRVSITLKDIKKIDQVTIKSLDIPAFLTGQTLKLLIKSQPEAFIKHIETKRKEG